jgi:uncharacterized repeat protein (TIGR03847 family)
MPRHIFDFGVPDRFVTGTVGQPGNRTFFIQARSGSAVLSVALEKIQVQALAERLGLLLAELARSGVRVPEALAPHDDDTASLDEPLVEAFRVGTMTIGWDGEHNYVVLEARAQAEEEQDQDESEGDSPLELTLVIEDGPGADEEDEDGEDEDGEEEADDLSDDDPEGPDILRVRLSPLRVRAFVERAIRVVTAGRPPCPLCGRPLDPGGHICPRRNGYVH